MRYGIEEGGVFLAAETGSECDLAERVAGVLVDNGLFLNNTGIFGTFDIVDDKDLYTADELLNMVNEAVKTWGSL